MLVHGTIYASNRVELRLIITGFCKIIRIKIKMKYQIQIVTIKIFSIEFRLSINILHNLYIVFYRAIGHYI